MNTEKIDEIIKILRAIADTSTSNKIPADFPLLRSVRPHKFSTDIFFYSVLQSLFLSFLPCSH